MSFNYTHFFKPIIRNYPTPFPNTHQTDTNYTNRDTTVHEIRRHKHRWIIPNTNRFRIFGKCELHTYDDIADGHRLFSDDSIFQTDGNVVNSGMIEENRCDIRFLYVPLKRGLPTRTVYRMVVNQVGFGNCLFWSLKDSDRGGWPCVW